MIAREDHHRVLQHPRGAQDARHPPDLLVDERDVSVVLGDDVPHHRFVQHRATPHPVGLVHHLRPVVRDVPVVRRQGHRLRVVHVEVLPRQIHRNVRAPEVHAQEEALALADRVVIMRDGEIRQIGSPWEIYKEPKTSFIAEFVGTSNFIAGKKKNGKVQFGRLVLEVLNLDDIDGETVYLAIRPENIELVDEAVSAENYLPSNIVEVEAEVINFLGAIVRITFILEEEEMIVDISEKAYESIHLKRKDKLKLYFPPEAFHVYGELFRKLI